MEKEILSLRKILSVVMVTVIILVSLLCLFLNARFHQFQVGVC